MSFVCKFASLWTILWILACVLFGSMSATDSDYTFASQPRIPEKKPQELPTTEKSCNEKLFGIAEWTWGQKGYIFMAAFLAYLGRNELNRARQQLNASSYNQAVKSLVAIDSLKQFIRNYGLTSQTFAPTLPKMITEADTEAAITMGTILWIILPLLVIIAFVGYYLCCCRDGTAEGTSAEDMEAQLSGQEAQGSAQQMKQMEMTMSQAEGSANEVTGTTLAPEGLSAIDASTTAKPKRVKKGKKKKTQKASANFAEPFTATNQAMAGNALETDSAGNWPTGDPNQWQAAPMAASVPMAPRKKKKKKRVDRMAMSM